MTGTVPDKGIVNNRPATDKTAEQLQAKLFQAVLATNRIGLRPMASKQATGSTGRRGFFDLRRDLRRNRPIITNPSPKKKTGCGCGIFVTGCVVGGLWEIFAPAGHAFSSFSI